MIIKRKIKKSINFIILLTELLMFMSSNSIAGVDDAYQHVYEVMDKYHQTFDVYTDLSAAGNHFVAYGAMGDEDKLTINPGCKISPHSGDTCFENRFIVNGNNWGGWYFMNGVLEGAETQPKLNWGDYPDAGVNLTGAKHLIFWARGANGGEQVEFFAFGVGRNATTGNPVKPYPDSSRKVSLGYKTLSANWTQYSINLTGLDLSYVLGGFGWVTNAPKNNYHDITFYLDDIRYDKSRLDEPRFLVSYETIPSSNDFDMVLKNVAFTYDNALTLIALLARGTAEDMDRAWLLADAFVYAINNDRYFTDGRLRDTYQGGDLVLPPGWTPNGRENTVRMTGWWDPNHSTWYENKGFVGTSTGNLAWAMIALLSYYEQVNDSNYLDAAEVLGEWIEANTRDANGAGGYIGGYEGWEATSNNPQGQTKLPWKSTEHNIDVYVAFTRLYELTGEPNWLNGALSAQTFVEAMWDANEGHFWTGTLNDGITINKSNIPLDIQAWVLMAMNGYNSALVWAENNCYTEADGFKGFDFNNDKDGVWFEGTAQMAVAYQLNAEPNKSDSCISELRNSQTLATNANGKGIVAASHDGVTTGFGWEYFNRLHIGATAWYIFAEMEYNPYWGTRTTPESIDFGSLMVTLGPAEAVSAGAQWNVDGGGWQNSGATVTSLSVGSHTVNYKSITSWAAPSSEQVNINSGQTTQISRNYTQQLSNLCKFGSFGDQKNVKLTLKDCNNNDVTFMLTGPGYGEIDCCDCDFGKIVLHETTEKSALLIKTKGKTGTSIGDIIVNGSLKSISAKTTDLRGDITVTGSLGKLMMRDIADDHEINIGSSSSPKAAAMIKVGRISNLTVDSKMPIKKITATEWLGGAIEAPWVGSIAIKGDKKRGIAGDFEADIDLDGIGAPKEVTLKKVKVAGTITGGNWVITGHCGSIQMAASEPGFEIYLNGNLGALKVTGNKKLGIPAVLSGELKCNSVKSISAVDIVEAQIELEQEPDPKLLAIGKLSAKGWIDGSEILSKGNIGTVMAGGIRDSCCFARVTTKDEGNGDGVLDLPDPNVDIDYAEPATIKSIKVKGIKGESYSVINSNIAAANILSAYFAYPQNANDGTPFGIAADYIKKLSVKDETGTKSYKELDEPKDSKEFDDMKIRLGE